VGAIVPSRSGIRPHALDPDRNGHAAMQPRKASAARASVLPRFSESRIEPQSTAMAEHALNIAA
jgi:hypothetical protein